MALSDAITNRGLWADVPEGVVRALARQAGAQAAAVRIPLFVAADKHHWLVAHWPRQTRRSAVVVTDTADLFPPIWRGDGHPLLVRTPVATEQAASASKNPDGATPAFTECVRVAIPMPLDAALECVFYFDGALGTAPSNATCAEAALLWLPQLRNAMRENTKLLTPREAECIRLAFQGLTAGEVGERLNCSDRTVNFHYANIMARLGVRSKLAAVLLLSWLGVV